MKTNLAPNFAARPLDGRANNWGDGEFRWERKAFWYLSTVIRKFTYIMDAASSCSDGVMLPNIL